MFVKFKKFAAPIFLYLTALLLGLVIGVYIADRSQAYFPKNDLESLAKYSDYAYKTYQSGNTSAANTALLGFLDQLDSVIKSNETHIDAQYLDKMLTYGRLALLEEVNKKPADERRYMDLAISICKELKREECSAVGIRGMVKRIDDLHNKSNKSETDRN